MDHVALYAFRQDDVRSIPQRIRLSVQDFRPSFPPAGLTISRAERGKPYFADASLELSISHSGKWWVLGLCDKPLGIDVQELKPARFQALAQRFFHPEEAAYLARSAYQNFYEIWTKKESYVKLTGRGIDADFGRFSVLSLPVHFQQVDLEEGYCLTVCTSEPPKAILKLF